jgi:hypothetical protein
VVVHHCCVGEEGDDVGVIDVLLVGDVDKFPVGEEKFRNECALVLSG